MIGWRPTFALVTLVALALLGWIGVAVPDAPGQRPKNRQPILKALRLPGVVAVLLVTAAYVPAHNILYTYIAAFLDARESVLLVFGIASTASVFVTGALVDCRLRALTITATVLFMTASVVLITSAGSLVVVYGVMVLWGLGWGGVATLLQTAVTDTGGDRGQALFVTVCNSSIAGGGAIGGVLLGNFGPAFFPWTILALLTPALAVVITARAHAFPTGRTSEPVSADRRMTPRPAYAPGAYAFTPLRYHAPLPRLPGTPLPQAVVCRRSVASRRSALFIP